MGEKARLRAEVERLGGELSLWRDIAERLFDERGGHLDEVRYWRCEFDLHCIEARRLRDKYEPHNRPRCNRVLDDGEPCGESVLPGCERCFECELWMRRLSDE